jgi:hypothetical protein
LLICCNARAISLPRPTRAEIALWSDEDEIVVYHLAPLEAIPFGDEFLLRGLIVHEHDAGVAAGSHASSSSCADGKIVARALPGCSARSCGHIAAVEEVFGAGGASRRTP